MSDSKCTNFPGTHLGLHPPCTDFPGQENRFRVLNAHRLPRQNWDSRYKSVLRKTRTQGAHISGTCFAAPLHLLNSKCPLLWRSETMWDLPLECFRKPCQDNAMEQTKSPRLCSVASDCREQIDIIEMTTEINSREKNAVILSVQFKQSLYRN